MIYFNIKHIFLILEKTIENLSKYSYVYLKRMKVLISKFHYEDLEILVTKKNIKNIYLKVYPPDGRINLSVPRSISQNDINIFINKKYQWIKNAQNRMSGKNLNFKEWSKEEIKIAKEYLTNIVPGYISKWEKIMDVNVNSWYARRMKTRWGSCNLQKARICLNLSLALKEDKYLEYIIVHEMVHLKERYHNKRFYSFMDKYLPDWRILKKELRNT